MLKIDDPTATDADGPRGQEKCSILMFLNITDRKGAENPVADNLSRLENIFDDPLPIDDSFPDE